MKGQGELEDGEWRPPPIDQPEEDTGQPWQEVRYRKRMGPFRRKRYEYEKDVVVFFVGNLPDGCTVAEIKVAFKNFGRLIDVYLPGRRDKNGKGNLYAFVKYSGVKDTCRFEAILNSVTIGGAKLSVNIAKFDRNRKPILYQKTEPKASYRAPPKIWVQKFQSHSTSEWCAGGSSLSYRDKLVGSVGTNGQFPIVNVEDTPDSMMKRLADFTVIGKLKSFKVLDNFITGLDGKLGYASSVRYVGGLRLMISFVNNNDAKEYCEDRSKRGRWFHSMVLWSEDYTDSERIARIRIYGVPLSIWTCETFEKIAKRYGEIVQSEGCNWTKANFAYEEVDILVKSGERIKDTVLVEKGSKRFMVWVNETDLDWQPSCVLKNKRMASYESEPEDNDKTAPNSPRTMDDPERNPKPSRPDNPTEKNDVIEATTGKNHEDCSSRFNAGDTSVEMDLNETVKTLT